MKENFLMDRLKLNTTIGRRKWVFFLRLIFGQAPIRVPPTRVFAKSTGENIFFFYNGHLVHGAIACIEHSKED